MHALLYNVDEPPLSNFNLRIFNYAIAGEAVGDASPEEFPVDPVEVSPADFVAPVPVPEFRPAWEALGNENEVSESVPVIDAAPEFSLACLCYFFCCLMCPYVYIFLSLRNSHNNDVCNAISTTVCALLSRFYCRRCSCSSRTGSASKR